MKGYLGDQEEVYSALVKREWYLTARFWSKVRVRGKLECWEWQAGLCGPMGYGRFHFEREVAVYAHRASWMLTKGPVPDGLVVCHHCDVPRCVNPAHLFLGTPADNARDRNQKGRQARQRGSQHPRAKLTERQVAEIRSRYAAGGILQRELAREFGVTQNAISSIVLQKRWTPLEPGEARCKVCGGYARSMEHDPVYTNTHAYEPEEPGHGK